MPSLKKLLPVGAVLAVGLTFLAYQAFRAISRSLTVPDYQTSDKIRAEINGFSKDPKELSIIATTGTPEKPVHFGCTAFLNRNPDGKIVDRYHIKGHDYYSEGTEESRLTPFAGSDAEKKLTNICNQVVDTFNTNVKARRDNFKQKLQEIGPALFNDIIGNTDMASRLPEVPDENDLAKVETQREGTTISFSQIKPDDGIYKSAYTQGPETQKPEMTQSALQGLGAVPKKAAFVIMHKDRDQTFVVVSQNLISILDQRTIFNGNVVTFWHEISKPNTADMKDVPVDEKGEYFQAGLSWQTPVLEDVNVALSAETSIPTVYTREQMIELGHWATGQVERLATLGAKEATPAAPGTQAPEASSGKIPAP